MDELTETVTQPGALKATGDRAIPTLRVLFSAQHGIVLSPRRVLQPGELIIGRETAHAELASLDASVSRRHAVIEVGAGGAPVTIADAGSRNGTFVNGRPVQRHVLSDGDVIGVGHCLLLLRYEPATLADAPIEELSGRSPAIRAIRHLIDRVARTSATVLLLGESGAGKSLAAQALHAHSGRSGPFVSVNCAAIPEGLAESQLFGHVAGAFTGAQREHLGYFRGAEGGTLLLDEVAELNPGIQAKLLAVLEERRVTPVGSVQPVPCDVRLVAATNADLSEAVSRRAFRGDLYARLSEIVVTLPPLRARREDILALVLRGLGDPPPKMSSRLAQALVLYDWPYNVRELSKIAMDLRIRSAGVERLELEMVAERLAVQAPSTHIAAAPSEPPPRGPVPTREELERLLREKRGIVSEIALATGRSRKQVYRWLGYHELDLEQFRDK